MSRSFRGHLLISSIAVAIVVRSEPNLATADRELLSSGGLEKRMCLPEAQWLHPTYMSRAWSEPEDLWLDGGDELRACAERVREASKTTVSEIHHFTQNWSQEMTHGAPACNLDLGRAINYEQPCSTTVPLLQPEAFRSSVLSRGNPQRLQSLFRKLGKCQDYDFVSIAVLGGSETAGSACQGHRTIPNSNRVNEEVPPTDFLNLTWLKRGVVFGDNECPWANRLKTLLENKYPKCTIDVFNMAQRSTDTSWALNRLESIFSGTAARDKRRLSEVVDLVLVDYGVNDGYLKDDLQGTYMSSLGRKRNIKDWQSILEARSEYLFEHLLLLPSNPAVVNVEIGAPDGGWNPTLAHLEAAERLGIPFVGYREALSYPNDPRFQAFGRYNPRASYFRHDCYPGGLYQNRSAEVQDAAGPHDLIPTWPVNGVFPATVDPKSCSQKSGDVYHPYFARWGLTSHCSKGIHASIAQVVYYFLQVSSAAYAHFLLNSVAGYNESPSADAILLRQKLDPLASCLDGVLSLFDSRALFGLSDRTELLGDWDLVEDRPGKFGWIIQQENYNLSRATIVFKIKMSSRPYISIEYMHTYDKNAGSVQVYLLQDGLPAFKANSEGITSPNVGNKHLSPGSSCLIDAYKPHMQYSSITELNIVPKNYKPGWAFLYLTLVNSHNSRRAGTRFKLHGVQSC